MKRLSLLSFFCASAAFATTLLAADVPALSRSADAIVIGKVTHSTARLTQNGGRVITDTEIQVTEVLKGKVEGPVIVMQPGGVVGDLGQRVEGTAPFVAGEEVLVFLDRRGAERFAVTGMVQGKYRIQRSTDGKAVYAMPETGASARLIDPVTGEETHSTQKSIGLALLKAQIATALAGPLPVEPTRPVTPRVGQ